MRELRDGRHSRDGVMTARVLIAFEQIEKELSKPLSPRRRAEVELFREQCLEHLEELKALKGGGNA